MVWGEFEPTDTQAAQGTKRARDAASEWEAILEGRKTKAPHGPSLWGSLEAKQKKCIAIDFNLGSGQVHVKNGAEVLSRLPAVRSMMSPESDGSAAVDLSTAGLSCGALLAALRFALAGPGANEYQPELWTTEGTRPISKASQDPKTVEDALHALEVLRAAAILGLPRLQEAAEKRLIGERPLLCKASAMPLLASSFGRERRISQRCMQLLTSNGFLDGRERQLGVIYATHPVVGCLLSGVFKAVKPEPAASTFIPSPVMLDLLLGPKRPTPGLSADVSASGSGAKRQMLLGHKRKGRVVSHPSKCAQVSGRSPGAPSIAEATQRPAGVELGG